jgi:hypothetical protein
MYTMTVQGAPSGSRGSKTRCGRFFIHACVRRRADDDIWREVERGRLRLPALLATGISFYVLVESIECATP